MNTIWATFPTHHATMSRHTFISDAILVLQNSMRLLLACSLAINAPDQSHSNR